jgi:hypothetical protein
MPSSSGWKIKPSKNQKEANRAAMFTVALAYFSNLKLEAVYSYETSVNFYIQEDS